VLEDGPIVAGRRRRRLDLRDVVEEAGRGDEGSRREADASTAEGSVLVGVVTDSAGSTDVPAALALLAEALLH
jgi:hypothetical protein